jgi:DNA-binding MarR family transcriptional regulator
MPDDNHDPKPAIPGDKAPSSLAFLLSQIGIFASRRFHERMDELGLHPALFRLLNVVDAAEGESQHTIGEAIEVPASRMVALVDELEQRGLIERRPDAADRRVRNLHLTRKGRSTLERGRKVAAEHERSLTKGMSPSEHKELVALLGKLAAGQGIKSGVHPGLSRPDGSG